MKKIRHKDYFLDEEEAPEEKKRRGDKMLSLLIAILSVTIIVVLFFLVFHVRVITVTGNQYCTEDEVKAWIQGDKYATNSIYVWWKYNYTDVKQLPLADTAEVSITAPWKINVRVYEKSIVGYLDYDGMHVYFDKDGVVILETADVLEGVPGIEGVTANLADIVVHEELPVEDKKIFSDIFSLSQSVKKEKLTPDRIVMGGDGAVTLYFGNVLVQLGTSGFTEKMEQIPPIIAKLTELYPGQGGTLHLENYSESLSSINFTPEVVENE